MIKNTFDIETFLNDDKVHIPYCVCYLINEKNFFKYYSDNTDIIFESINDIFNIVQPDQKTYIYVHNLDYDGFFIIDFLTKNTLKFETFFKNMSLYSIKIYKDKKTIVFKCSYKILPSSLNRISESFNLSFEKTIFPYDFSSLKNLNYEGTSPDSFFFNNYDDFLTFNKKIKNNKFNFKEYSIEYCRNDTIITSLFLGKLEKILSKFEISLDKINSAPSLALKIFVEKFNNNKISFSINTSFQTIIRKSYFGGRCEVYGNPIENDLIYHFDFEGMYGQCMSEKIPYGSLSFSSSENNCFKPGFYNIDYDSDMFIPILPIKDKKNGKLMFLNGSDLNGTFYNEEICYFLKKGGILKKINYAVVYSEYGYVFDEYVSFFNKFRNMGGEHKVFGKLMINSLYGRFGMNIPETHTFFIKKNDYEKLNSDVEIINMKEINDFYLMEITINKKLIKKLGIKKKKIKTNISVASTITSKARIKLHTAQSSVIENGGRLLYSDTDSIFAAYTKNVLDETHGLVHWDSKKKNTMIKDAFFINPKSYGILYENNEYDIKIKGLNEKKMNFEDLKKKFYNDEKLKIEKFKFIQKKDLKIKTEFLVKTFDLSVYDKRKFTKNKKETTPFTLQDFEYK